MVNELLDLFKTPVTSISKRAEERNIKKEAITAAIIAVVIALVTLLTSYIGINKAVKKSYPSLDEYNEDHYYSQLTKEEFKEAKKEYKSDLMESAKIGGGFFKTIATVALAICVIAGMLYIISRMVKSPKDYTEMIAMTNGAFIIYLAGFLLNTIFSYIYSPIAMILSGATVVYAIISLANAFRESIEVEDIDKLTMYSSIVITVVFAILVFATYQYIESLFSIGSLNLLDL